MSGGGADAGTATIHLLVGADRSGYPRDKIWACSSVGGGDTVMDKLDVEGE